MEIFLEPLGKEAAVRIPAAALRDLALSLNDAVDLRTQDGQIIITPLHQNIYTLEGLLADITPQTLHTSVEWGEAVGHEAW